MPTNHTLGADTRGLMRFASAASARGAGNGCRLPAESAIELFRSDIRSRMGQLVASNPELSDEQVQRVRPV